MYKFVGIFLAGFIVLFSGCAGVANNLYKFDYISLDFISDIDNEVSKTSGLIDIDGRLFTHNDSGDATIYEINATTGFVERRISINGALNTAWEDLAYDDTYVYIADIGNASGARTELQIYKVLKSDLLNYANVDSQKISFSYADQVGYTYGANTTPYDAEALIVYDNELYVFTKNWEDYTTRVYNIPNTVGFHSVSQIADYYFELMITGASVDKLNNSIALIGYSDPYDATMPQVSEIIILSDFANTNFFSGAITTYEISDDQTTSRLESIAYDTPTQLYLTTEAVSPYTAKLYKAVLP